MLNAINPMRALSFVLAFALASAPQLLHAADTAPPQANERRRLKRNRSFSIKPRSISSWRRSRFIPTPFSPKC
jgi:hypothetical protein